MTLINIGSKLLYFLNVLQRICLESNSVAEVELRDWH